MTQLMTPYYFFSFFQLHKTITDFERQKLDQEQRHAKHIQQVVGDCGRRIGQMERDCASQISTSVSERGTRLRGNHNDAFCGERGGRAEGEYPMDNALLALTGSTLCSVHTIPYSLPRLPLWQN